MTIKLGVPDLIDPEPPMIMANNSQRSITMGRKRQMKIKESVQQKYAGEIAQSEKMATTGYDKSKGNPKDRINTDVYGPTDIPTSPVAEMQKFEEVGLADDTIRKASLKELNNSNDLASQAVAAVQAAGQQLPVQPTQPGQIPPNEMPNLNPQMAPQVAVQPPAEEPEQLSDDPVERLKQVAEKLREQFPNAPTAEILAQWKNLHGDIFILPIEDKVYIYRYLKRQEWNQMQANAALQELRPDQYEDMLFTKCMLWPVMSPQHIAALPAGSISMIVEQIRMQSYFLDPVQVANLTLKL